MFKAKNKKNKKYYGFTLVELIIVITILSILSTIAFVSFSGYTSKTRDSNRLFSLKEISKALEIQKEMTSKYPQPDEIYVQGGIPSLDETLFSVGLIGKNVSNFVKLGSIPLDPKIGNEYLYGLTRDNKNFQIAGTLENLQSSIIVPVTYADNGMQALVEGNYKGLIRFTHDNKNYIGNIPSLIFSRTGTYTIEKRFVINKGQNLPYSFDGKSLGTGLTPELVLKELHNKDSLTLTGIVVTYPKSEDEIKDISKRLGVSDLIVAETLGNKEYVEKYADKGGSSGGQNSGDNQPVNRVLKIIDFENPADYTSNNSLINELYEESNDNYGGISTEQKVSGNNSFKLATSYGDGNRTSCVEFSFNSTKNFYIDFSYRNDVYVEGTTIFYKKDGVFVKNYENPKNFSDIPNFSIYIDTSSEWKNIDLSTYGELDLSSTLTDKYFIPGNYLFNLCSYSTGMYLDDIKFVEYFVGTCATQPNYTNANYTTGIPDILNKAWQNTNPKAGCYYECKLGFGGNDCSQSVSLSFYDKLFYGLKNKNLRYKPGEFFKEYLFNINNNVVTYENLGWQSNFHKLHIINTNNNISSIDIKNLIGKVGNSLYYIDNNDKLISFDGNNFLDKGYTISKFVTSNVEGYFIFRSNGENFLIKNDETILKINTTDDIVVNSSKIIGIYNNNIYFTKTTSNGSAYYNLYSININNGDFTAVSLYNNRISTIKDSYVFIDGIFYFSSSYSAGENILKMDITNSPVTMTTVDGDYSNIYTLNGKIYAFNKKSGIQKFFVYDLNEPFINDSFKDLNIGTIPSYFTIDLFENNGKIYIPRVGIGDKTFIYDISNSTSTTTANQFIKGIDGETIFEIINNSELIEHSGGTQKTRTGFNFNSK